MSLNWKEIDVVLSELCLAGAQIQKITQPNYSTLNLALYGAGAARNLLIVTAAGVCRLHATYRAVPRSEKPLRFAELLKSRVLNARIESARQLGSDRIVLFKLRKGESAFFLFARLWSNAANVILAGEDGVIIDALRRLPKRGEVSGAALSAELAAAIAFSAESEVPPAKSEGAAKEDKFEVRELAGEGSFNERIDAWYAEHGGALSLEALRAEASRSFEGSMARISMSIDRLQEKEKRYTEADRLKEYGEIVLANLHKETSGRQWLEAEDFYRNNEPIRIKIDGQKTGQQNAAVYFEQYRKAKHGLESVRAEIEAAREELARQKRLLEELLAETNPLRLHKRLKTKGAGRTGDGKTRPGLSFRRGDWLIFVGRSAAENDELLRRHVKGNDLWLHARDFAGAYVFVKARAGKTVPLNILLDAGNLALFYSKGRSAGKGDLFYTHAKYLRRVKNGPRGLVLPTQEKNLAIALEDKRLRELELCRV
jgi:predicted ribosome quality control (RQC) complex YloA/Tae2 family protein